MMKKFFQTKDMTEIFLGLYVIVGFLLLIMASKIEVIDSFEKVAENKVSIIASLILAIMSGIVTYFIRNCFFKFDQSIIKDPNELTKENLFAIVHGSSLSILGLVILILPPTSNNFLYVLILGILIIIIALNTYFSGFWLKRVQGEDSVINTDALKLEHVEWSHFSNNICLAFLVTTGGIFITYFSTSHASSFLTSNNDIFHILVNYINPMLIIYVTFLTPLIWLLRPIHANMNQIRNKITKVNSDIITSKNDEHIDSLTK